MPSVMKHNVAQVPQAKIQRSIFDLSCTHKSTFDAGKLIPAYVEEILPGDTFSVEPKIFARLATPIYPLMDNMFMDIHFFFVPNRLIWTNWEKMMGEQTNPGDSIAYQTPIVTVNAGAGVGFTAGSLYDYLGIPTEIDDISVINIPARGYNQIYNDWYRDENLQNSVVVDTDDGPDTISDYTILTRGKRHDYFTTCLPWPQKGTAVTFPLGTTAPVVSTGDTPVFAPQSGNAFGDGKLWATISGGRMFRWKTEGSPTDGVEVKFDDGVSENTGLETDLSAASAGTINDLREAFATQQLLEMDARGGTRLQEVIRVHFGVTGDDARLQRPEFIWGSSVPVVVTPVAQQSATSGSNVLGDLAGMGVASHTRGGFTKSFVEHGWLFGIVSVRADLTYSQGIPRKFARRDRYDY